MNLKIINKMNLTRKILIVSIIILLKLINGHDFSFENPPLIKSPTFPLVLYEDSGSPQSVTIIEIDIDPYENIAFTGFLGTYSQVLTPPHLLFGLFQTEYAIIKWAIQTSINQKLLVF